MDHGAPGASPEATRQRARDQVRATLRALLAQHFQLPLSAIAVDDRRGARVRAALVAGTPVPPGWATLGLSISHEAGVALIALRTAGPVGVDLAALPVGWPCEGDVLQRQAALYLGPDHAAAQPGADAAAFVRGWAALEARLKCLETPLGGAVGALRHRRVGAVPRSGGANACGGSGRVGMRVERLDPRRPRVIEAMRARAYPCTPGAHQIAI